MSKKNMGRNFINKKIKKKYLIIGSKGFLGSNLYLLLKKKNEIVYGDNKKYDLKKINNVLRLFENIKPDVVINCAGKTGGVEFTNSFPSTILEENIRINSNIFEVSKIFKVKRLILIGASCMYPEKKNGKFKEENLFFGPMHKSVEAYGFWKLSQIVFMNAYKKQFKLNSFCLIFPNIYGPGDKFQNKSSHVIAALIRKFYMAKKNNYKFVNLLGTGQEIRDSIYIDDAVNVIYKILKRSFRFGYLNASSGESFSIKTLAEKIKKKISYKGLIKWEKNKTKSANYKILSTEKIKKKINWEPKFNLTKGLNKTIEWYIQNH